MSRRIKKPVIVYLLFCILFLLISCDPDENKDYDNDFGSGILGKHLSLSGQVYGVDDGMGIWGFSDYLELRSSLGGTGVLKKDGQFSFNIGIPNKLGPNFDWDWVYPFMYRLNNFQVSPASAQVASLPNYWVLNVYNNSESTNAFIGALPQTSIKDITDDFSEYFSFVYVDRDVTISADKSNFKLLVISNDTVEAFNIRLKAGWNAVFIRTVRERNGANTSSYTTILHAMPKHLKWGIGFIMVSH